METKNNTHYSIEDKYFRILPEGRIRRRQYFGRIFGAGVIIGIFSFGIMTILGVNNSMDGSIIINAVGSVVGLAVWYFLNTKRIRDIGKNPKIIQKITIGLIIWNIFNNIYIFLGEKGLIYGYIGRVQQILDKAMILLGGKSEVIFPWHQTIMIDLMYIYQIIAVVLFLYLFLTPGKKGDNEYGKDPMNTKLGFLG